MHSHEQVIVADVVKECFRFAVGLNGFVDLFTVWCQSHHIIAYVVPGHVDVPDVLILLLGWQLEKIFASQGFFFLRTVIVIVAKLTLVAVISSKVLIAFARFVVKSKRSVMALVVFLERLVMTELEGPITNDHFLSCTSVSTATAWCTKSFWDWTTFLVFQIRQEFTNSRELTFSLVRWTQLRQETWWYGSSSYLGLPKWIKRIVHFREKVNV